MYSNPLSIIQKIHLTDFLKPKKVGALDVDSAGLWARKESGKFINQLSTFFKL